MSSDSAGSEVFTTTVRLVQSAKRGDRQALDDLFARYLPRVRQIVSLRLGWRLRRILDHEDIVQGALLQVLEGLDRFEHRSEGSFRNWLAHCVQVEISGQARRAEAKKRGGGRVVRFGDCDTGILHESIFAGSEPSPSAVAHAAELTDKIEDVLLDMPERYRELIIQRNVCGMSYTEIAQEMGFAKEGGARMAYSRALEKLRQAIDSDAGGEGQPTER